MLDNGGYEALSSDSGVASALLNVNASVQCAYMFFSESVLVGVRATLVAHLMVHAERDTKEHSTARTNNVLPSGSESFILSFSFFLPSFLYLLFPMLASVQLVSRLRRRRGHQLLLLLHVRVGELGVGEVLRMRVGPRGAAVLAAVVAQTVAAAASMI